MQEWYSDSQHGAIRISKLFILQGMIMWFRKGPEFKQPPCICVVRPSKSWDKLSHLFGHRRQSVSYVDCIRWESPVMTSWLSSLGGSYNVSYPCSSIVMNSRMKADDDSDIDFGRFTKRRRLCECSRGTEERRTSSKVMTTYTVFASTSVNIRWKIASPPPPSPPRCEV